MPTTNPVRFIADPFAVKYDRFRLTVGRTPFLSDAEEEIRAHMEENDLEEVRGTIFFTTDRGREKYTLEYGTF